MCRWPIGERCLQTPPIQKPRPLAVCAHLIGCCVKRLPAYWFKPYRRIWEGLRKREAGYLLLLSPQSLSAQVRLFFLGTTSLHRLVVVRVVDVKVGKIITFFFLCVTTVGEVRAFLVSLIWVEYLRQPDCLAAQLWKSHICISSVFFLRWFWHH